MHNVYVNINAATIYDRGAQICWRKVMDTTTTNNAEDCCDGYCD